MDIATILSPLEFILCYQIYLASRLTDKQKINRIAYYIVQPLIENPKARLPKKVSAQQISKIILENLKLNYK